MVSIILPTYNVENHIAECLESLVVQSYGIDNIEVLIIDDCGQDNTLSIVEQFLPLLGSQSRIIKHPFNKGLGAARNSGIDASTGDFLLFLDSDDYLEKDVIDKTH